MKSGLTTRIHGSSSFGMNRRFAYSMGFTALWGILSLSTLSCAKHSEAASNSTAEIQASTQSEEQPTLRSCPREQRIPPEPGNRTIFVRFEFVVDTLGHVVPETIRRIPDRRQRSDVPRHYVTLARDMAAQCRFEPAMRDQSPVLATTQVSIRLYSASGDM